VSERQFKWRVWLTPRDLIGIALRKFAEPPTSGRVPDNWAPPESDNEKLQELIDMSTDNPTAPDWRDTACENIERALAGAPREFEPTYTLTLGTGEHKTVVELSAYERVVEERDRLRAALERWADEYGDLHEIAREALK
jgi:hypothetical protein